MFDLLLSFIPGFTFLRLVRGRLLVQQTDDRRTSPWWAWLLLLFVLVLLVLWWLRRRPGSEAPSGSEAAHGNIEPKAQPLTPALETGGQRAAVLDLDLEQAEEHVADAGSVAPVDNPAGEPEDVALTDIAIPASNDLTEIEGIGPKLSAILQAAGITTFSQLAQTTPENILTILRAAGHNIADPTSWPEQARLLAAGDWEGFKALTSRLKGGRYRD